MPHEQRPDTLLDLFDRSAARFSDLPAVSDSENSLTYRELDERSDALRTALVSHGVGKEDRVGLYMSRSVDTFVAILGILKAGGAYVAIDSRYPDVRRDLMVRDSGTVAVICEPSWEGRLTGLGVPVLAHRHASVPAPTASRPAVEPDDAASVLFTSGSSGTPKAIVLEHRNIVSFACNSSLPPLVPGDRTGQISSLSFDAFHFEMWTSLAHGAEVVVLPPVPDLLAAGFHQEMHRHRISAMLVPTMAFNHLVREEPDAFASLRILHVGGDVVLPSACRDVLASTFTGQLYNLYGPAEITTACTAHLISPSDVERDSIPIGRALHDVTVHVLDEALRPVLPGAVGEMYVGGAGVARGYLDRPDLTAERFLPDPFSGAGHLYRTGDLARRREDGVLEFVGRADNQVKIRGYRVEPGEVERGLRRNPDVHDAAVLAAGQGNDRHLVAFVVLDQLRTLMELRASAENEFPDFMVPSLFIVVPEIPANTHGKRDMDALNDLLDRHQERRDKYVAPTTGCERYLAGLWEDLLAIEQVGVTDNFFELGGHSLLAHRIQTRIKRDLGVVLEQRVIIRTATLADLAAAVEEVKDDADIM